jgi:uncharacterized membrane protein YkoI
MRRLLTLAVFGLTLAAGYTLASDPGMGSQVPRDQWLPLDKVERMVRSRGYEVRKIEIDDDGYYEVKAIDPDGRRVEAEVDPVTGKILKVERDD